ncbi:MAG: AsmA-like C-terminal region-containing protein, partial [Rickettsiales bacterium]|nr:AsmA-like C-terminal region-containing protein [Rickettsiales bacterium]
ANIMGHITVHQQLDNASDSENTYFFRSQMNAGHLKTLGIGEIPFIKGNFMVGVSITLKDDVSRILIKSDFTDTDIIIPQLGFNKPPKAPFAIDINSYLLPDNVVDIRNLYVKAGDLDVQGRAVIDRKHFILRELVLDKAVSKNNDLKLYYSMLNNKMNVVVKASKIDLSNVDYQLSSNGVVGGKHKNIQISSDIIQFPNDTFLSNVRGTFQCNPKHCERMEFNANINNKERLTLSLKPDTESPDILSRFILESDNIGGILKALNFSNNINGGYLRIDANSLISEESGNRIMQGEAILRDFTVIRTPILARLLTLASLNGVVDLLNGGGLKFKRFNLPFIIEEDILSIRNGSGHGNSIGLTVEGSIDTNKDSLNLTGTVIPAYMVNKVIGEIPIVGGILTGGKDQGVVAVKYDIKGPVSNPDITVNPLSILTPGFLRGVFDVMAPSEPTTSDQTDSNTAIPAQ